jgi:uncharacterized lipoprotein YddW (UPF0748 family)
MIYKKTVTVIISLIFIFSSLSAFSNPKREFRGAWIHTVDQVKYAEMTQKEMKTYFCTLLDKLKAAGINTVLFQIRPEADAWYKSSYEPWSRYITGTQGKDPGWDPLAFLIEECHKRNLDFHAWLNPYRVRNSPTKSLASDHEFFKNPWWFVEYGNLVWFDPGVPASRNHIIKVVKDILKHYDVDAIHMDDYFYPYPESKKVFNDSKSFAQYGKGIPDSSKADWRRENVNTLIRELHKAIHETKPWVSFGVSPFGIYRNLKESPNGSKTNGFTNYDGLYADVLEWINKGWIDYVIPQLYWEIGHKAADYETLIAWWAAHTDKVKLYIGQDVLRTIKPDSLKKGQLNKKMFLATKESNVSGHCFWPAYELERNAGGIVDSLNKKYFKYMAIQPVDNKLDTVPPGCVSNVTYKNAGKDMINVSWKAPEAKSEMDKARRYVVYGFKRSDKIDIENHANILEICNTNSCTIKLTGKIEILVVTALDRCHNESIGSKLYIKN